MSIRIDSIAANNVGPLGEFNHSLADLNLIYSQNEGGKTFLTEFITERLFAETSRWDIRSAGSGKVHVSSLDIGPDSFTKSTTPKLDELLVEQSGLPPRLATLLVVKGSDAYLDNVSGGADKSVIKDLISQRQVLEDIEDNINKTVRKADITTDPITIDKRGEGSDLRDIKDELQQTQQMIERIEAEYSSGELEQLRLEKKQWEEKLQEQKRAKRNKAYQLSQKLQDIKAETERYSAAAITRLAQNIENWQRKQKTISQKQTELAAVKEDADKHSWLQKAKETYQDLQQDGDTGSIPWYTASGVFVLAAIVTLTGRPLVGVAVFVLVAVLVGVPAYRHGGTGSDDQASQELQKLRQSFKEKTGEKLTGLTSIEHQIEKYSQARGKRSQIKSDLETLQNELNELAADIRQDFREITGEKSPDAWEDTLEDIQVHGNEKRQQQSELQNKLQRLQVDPDNYLADSVDVTYDATKEQEYENNLENVEEAIAEKEEELQAIRTQIQMLVQVETDDFSTLLEKLRDKHTRLTDKLQTKQSEIIAGRLVHEVIEDLRSQEDERIQSILQDSTITKHLRSLTGGIYEGIRLDGNELTIIGKTSDFPLSAISTGAREQVLMGLRAGMSEYLCDKTPMFMWLDDAFQNTDWQRREKVVAGITELIASGWQITYLTMDNHMRDLFQEAGRQMDAGFKEIEL